MWFGFIDLAASCCIDVSDDHKLIGFPETMGEHSQPLIVSQSIPLHKKDLQPKDLIKDTFKNFSHTDLPLKLYDTKRTCPGPCSHRYMTA